MPWAYLCRLPSQNLVDARIEGQLLDALFRDGLSRQLDVEVIDHGKGRMMERFAIMLVWNVGALFLGGNYASCSLEHNRLSAWKSCNP